MKKFTLVIGLLMLSSVMRAQFEKGVWIINPSVTGLGYSHSDSDNSRFGLYAKGGAFVMDNVALILTLSGEWTDVVDVYSIGTSGRYYFSRTGIYAGTGLQFVRQDYGNGKIRSHREDYGLNSEVGYAFFLSRTVTIEPGVYYNLSFKDRELSRFGFRVGFGFYF